MFSATKLRSSPPDGSSFSESRASVKSIWTQWAPPGERPPDVGLDLAEQVGEEGVARVAVYAVFGVQETERRGRDHRLLDGTRCNVSRSGEVAAGVGLVAERSSGQPRELAGVAVCERDHDTIRRELEPVDRVGGEARLPLLSVGDDR